MGCAGSQAVQLGRKKKATLARNAESLGSPGRICSTVWSKHAHIRLAITGNSGVRTAKECTNKPSLPPFFHHTAPT